MGAASTIGGIAKFIGKCLLAPIAVPLALLHTVVVGTVALTLNAMDLCWSVVRQKLFSTQLQYDSVIKGLADSASGVFWGGLKFFMSPYIDTAKAAHQSFSNITEGHRLEASANPYTQDYSLQAQQQATSTQVSDPNAQPLFENRGRAL